VNSLSAECDVDVHIAINQSLKAKRHKSRANRLKAKPSGYRKLWQKVLSLKHVWIQSQSLWIDNYMTDWRRTEAVWMHEMRNTHPKRCYGITPIHFYSTVYSIRRLVYFTCPMHYCFWSYGRLMALQNFNYYNRAYYYYLRTLGSVDPDSYAKLKKKKSWSAKGPGRRQSRRTYAARESWISAEQ